MMMGIVWIERKPILTCSRSTSSQASRGSFRRVILGFGGLGVRAWYDGYRKCEGGSVEDVLKLGLAVEEEM